MKDNKGIIAILGFMILSPSVNATLIDNGNGLIYDTLQNITWTKNANLLGSLEGNSQSSYDNLINTIISTVISVPSINTRSPNPEPSIHNLITADFGFGGTVSYWGAQAFVSYLNYINYKGSDQWSLPFMSTNADSRYGETRSQLGQLYYNELGFGSHYHLPGSPMPPNPFNNIQSDEYWFNRQFKYVTGFAYVFNFDNSLQNNNAGTHYAPSNTTLNYAWAVTPGNLNTVPLPPSIFIFVSGLIGLGISCRKKRPT